MLNNIIELADNKLLILYIIKKLKAPCSNTYITDIILSNNFLNYFILQQYLIELVESNYLIMLNSKTEPLYKLAPRGKKILEMFQNRISKFKIDCFNNYLSMLEKKNQTIDVNFKDSKTSNTHFLEISFNQNNENLLTLNLKIKNKEEVNSIIKNCSLNPAQTYNSILSILNSSKNNNT